MAKYILYVDYKARVGGTGILYTRLEATTLVEAMIESEKWYSDDVYLMRIMERRGKDEAFDKGWRKELYEAVICRRSTWWFPNDNAHCEGEHFAARFFGTGRNAGYEWFELVK